MHFNIFQCLVKEDTILGSKYLRERLFLKFKIVLTEVQNWYMMNDWCPTYQIHPDVGKLVANKFFHVSGTLPGRNLKIKFVIIIFIMYFSFINTENSLPIWKQPNIWTRTVTFLQILMIRSYECIFTCINHKCPLVTMLGSKNGVCTSTNAIFNVGRRCDFCFLLYFITGTVTVFLPDFIHYNV
jgi:hypothetical protein